MGFFDDVDKNEFNSNATDSTSAQKEFSDADLFDDDKDTDELVMEDDTAIYHESKEYSEEYREKPAVEVPVPSVTNKPIPTKIVTEKQAPTAEIRSENTQKNGKELGSTVIALGTTVEGNIHTDGGLSVSGVVNGDVSAKSGVTIARKGAVNGSIKAGGRVCILGRITGEIAGDEVTLEKTQVNGNITSTGLVNIGQGVVVIGDISATKATISGAIKGNIDVQGPVILESTAIIKGNIRSKLLQIETGAAVDGTCSQCYADTNPSAFFDNFSS